MNKIIAKLIAYLLILEIRIRGPHIKNSAWRRKLHKRNYVKNYDITTPLILATCNDKYRKVAYLSIGKVASTSLKRTFFDTEDIRKSYDQAKNRHREEIRNMGRLMNPRFLDPLNAMNHARVGDFPPALFSYLSNINSFLCQSNDFRLEEIIKEEGYTNRKTTLDEVNSYFIFTFVRSPFTRLVSCFQNRYKYQNRRSYLSARPTIFFWFLKISSFNDLIYKISKIPNFHAEAHFMPCHVKIDTARDLGVKIDFIGKFEALAQDFEKIRKRFNLLPLEHDNRSSGAHEDWRDYYTPQTAKMVYQRYRRDFEMFGYEDEYPKLLDYLASKSIKPHHE